MNRFKLYLILSIVMTLIIFTNSFMPAHISSAQSGFFSTFLYKIIHQLGINIQLDEVSWMVRKTAHFTQFFVLGMLWFLTWSQKLILSKTIKWALLFTCLTAVMDETIQLFSDGRAFSVVDILIDISGAITGILVLWVIRSLKQKSSVA